MTLFRFSAGAAMASVLTMLLLTSPAHAAGKDYRFEVLQTQPAGKDLTDVTVRLTHIPDGKPVTGAVIFQTRVDMGPEGMGDMTGKVTPQTADPAGHYRFRAQTGMAGKWALTLTAKVQGETDTIRGSVTFDAK
ncbi:MAG: heavy metal RND transporter [Acetobacteraceae bacterium]|nr:heavy metal RND transporter [Acetobacteraceae bacterium]